jgi:glutathionylspermidine synthase
MELLIDEVASDGSSLGKLFMDGYASGKFRMFNPPESIIMQCKGFQALIWALHIVWKDKNIFTSEENRIIDKYMLPTYFEHDMSGDVFKLSKKWIKKPIWGREGKGIIVVDNTNSLIMEKEIDNPEEVIQRTPKTCIYQKFVNQIKLPTKVDDPNINDGYFTLSCFMLGDEADALYARMSPEQIAGTEAYWSPVICDDKRAVI